ncbi:hypothetical protein ALP06_02569 [Pseudomonas coronafaciens pv. atropurpurea]|nr:hypothetical protein ALP06_02569 [Pseudomonas coronafaciens pv. atropurpurea]
MPGPLRDRTPETTHKVISLLNPTPQRRVEEYLQATWQPVERISLLIQALP